MATRRRRSRVSAYKWIGHIQVDFGDTERQHVLEYVGERNFDFEDAISQITQTQTSVKFTYDESRDGYQCTLQPKSGDCYLYGYTLGFRHAELSRCVQICSYIVFEMIENEAIVIPGTTASPSW